LDVDNGRGEISVRPSPDGRVHLVALKVVRNSDRRGADVLDRETRVETGVEGGVLAVRVLYPQRGQIRLDVWDLFKGVEIPEVEVRLALEAPPSLPVRLRSMSGDMETSGLAGRQELVSASGDVDVSDATGAVAIETRSGDATLANIASAEVSTASGKIVIGAVRGSVAVSTLSGDVRIDSANDSVRVATASGDVRVGLARSGLVVRTESGDVIARAGGSVHVITASGEAKIALIAPLERAVLHTGSGDVSVRLASGIDGTLDADAGGGDLSLDLPLDVQTRTDHHVVGRLGRGTSGIVIRTASGSVNVAR